MNISKRSFLKYIPFLSLILAPTAKSAVIKTPDRTKKIPTYEDSVTLMRRLDGKKLKLISYSSMSKNGELCSITFNVEGNMLLSIGVGDDKFLFIESNITV